MSNEMYNTIARVTDGIYEGEFLFFCSEFTNEYVPYAYHF